ncbi:TPA: UDP-N-acetylglucosamine 2-epimerase (non-hydrolyzing), partial [Candidatus Delongbacteria bacterium]|nr:UDP-N-acetylglucosamine 2-epimerase (non-hydrolyzing) [Candidatus Delongbacteria bacterium]
MKIVTVIGARPQFIKAAVVARELKNYPDIKEVLVHTGQHYDKQMSDIFFTELQIPEPDYNLAIGSGFHGEQTGKMLAGIEKILITEKP